MLAKIGILIIVLVSINSAWAENRGRSHEINSAPDYYPRVFKNQGIIQELNKSDKTAIINATKYHFGQNIKVHTLRDEFGSINNLRNGSNIAFFNL